jgi:hypothetical protein
MDSIEKAIRSAFAKGDPADRAFREKVYRSAFGALDRNLKTNPNMTEAIAQRRREALLAAVTAIETEFVPARPAEPQTAAPSVAPEKPAPSVAPDSPAPASRERGEPAFAPTLDGERRPRAQRRSDVRAEAPKRRGGGRRAPRLRWRLAGLLLFLLLLGAAAAGLWWLAVSGTGERLLTPAQTGANGGPPVSGASDALEGWVDIFTPGDPTTVSAPGDSRAEVMEEESERFMRITSGQSGAPVLFDIGQGVLEDIAGTRAVFNIVAEAREGGDTQISVDCSLAELGDCGRKRYAVGAAREEYLFEIELPASRPGTGGTIAINPDVEGRGRAVDIHAIRVRPVR